jgi:hypothetical protein
MLRASNARREADAVISDALDLPPNVRAVIVAMLQRRGGRRLDRRSRARRPMQELCERPGLQPLPEQGVPHARTQALLRERGPSPSTAPATHRSPSTPSMVTSAGAWRFRRAGRRPPPESFGMRPRSERLLAHRNRPGGRGRNDVASSRSAASRPGRGRQSTPAKLRRGSRGRLLRGTQRRPERARIDVVAIDLAADGTARTMTTSRYRNPRSARIGAPATIALYHTRRSPKPENLIHPRPHTCAKLLN